MRPLCLSGHGENENKCASCAVDVHFVRVAIEKGWTCPTASSALSSPRLREIKPTELQNEVNSIIKQF